MSYFICYMSYFICYMSYFICHMSHECLSPYLNDIIFLKPYVCHIVCPFMFYMLLFRFVLSHKSYSLYVLCHMSYFIYNMSKECLFTYSINIVFLKLVPFRVLFQIGHIVLQMIYYFEAYIAPFSVPSACFTFRSSELHYILCPLCHMSIVLYTMRSRLHITPQICAISYALCHMASVVYILLFRFALYFMP